MSDDRKFIARPPGDDIEPLLIGMMGPPAGGKTVSSLRLAAGMQKIRGGRVILIDTEAGRSKKYHIKRGGDYDFDIVDFEPPFRSNYFLDAIKQQLASKPACIIVDSCSDEHAGEGGYIEWAAEMVPRMGGNEWAAFAKPSAARQRLVTGILHIKTPLIFTFRGKTRTAQIKEPGKKTEIVKLGWQPIAPLEIVHALDLCCILPNNADGVPAWTTALAGEEAIIKRPKFLAKLVPDGQITEAIGEKLALWQLGKGFIENARPTPTVDPERNDLLNAIGAHLKALYPGDDDTGKQARMAGLIDLGLPSSWPAVTKLPIETLRAVKIGGE